MKGIPPDALRFAQDANNDPRRVEAKRAAIDSRKSLYTMQTGWELHYFEGCGLMRKYPGSETDATDEQLEIVAFCLHCHNAMKRRRGLK